MEIRKLESGSYKIIAETHIGLDGKRHRRSVTFTPTRKSEKAIEKEVQAFALAFEKKVKGETGTDARTFTFERYIEEWKKSVPFQNLTIKTQEELLAIQKNRLLPFIGKKRIVDITPAMMRSLVGELSKKYAAKTVKKTIYAANVIFNLALDDEVIAVNPMERVQLPKDQEGSEKLHFFDIPEAKLFLRVLNSPVQIIQERKDMTTKTGRHLSGYTKIKESSISTMWRAYFTLALYSGCRRGEMVALKWDDFSFKDQTISVRRAVQNTKSQGNIIKTPKTAAGVRTFELPKVVFDVLKEWRKEQNTMIPMWKDYDNFIFTQEDGSMMFVTSPTEKFKDILRNYNRTAPDGQQLPIIRLHDLRHTSATLMIASGIDVETVAKRLGHADVSVTLNIYGHATNEADHKASMALEALLA